LTSRLRTLTLPHLKTIFPISAIALAVFAAGCKPEGVRVYEAPKDQPFVPHEESAPETGVAAAPTEVWRPVLNWTLPAGWKDLSPDSANVGRFSAGNASVAITALGSMEGKESLLVNMWRQVRGQPPLEETEAAQVLKEVPIAGATGRMFEVSETEGEKPARFVVAFVHRPEGSLFFKIQGPDDEVTAQKAAFLEFLKTVRFAEGVAAAPAPAAAPSSAEPAWSARIPEGWTSVPPGPMQQAKYAVTVKDGAKAEVTVSVFPSATGGTVENVKRWRRQLGLAEIPDAEVAPLAQPLNGAPEGSVIVDLKNENRAMVGAIVPRDGKWWFLKLTGEAPAVASARDAFVVFVTTGS
jgi:hypothetical protein